MVYVCCCMFLSLEGSVEQQKKATDWTSHTHFHIWKMLLKFFIKIFRKPITYEPFIIYIFVPM